MAIVAFVIGHWFVSLFFHSVFLHRYASHRQFTMSPLTERIFFILTWIVQGSSFLHPKAYAIMHRLHHTHSDSDLDPHSPHHHGSVLSMMRDTYMLYRGLSKDFIKGKGDAFEEAVPSWPALEKFADLTPVRIGWIVVYAAIYALLVTSWWGWLLFPITVVMGPLQGALVNWCGHKYGYVNFRETADGSRNTLPFDLLGMGELFQNNHHRYPRRANFAVRRFEFDPTFPILRLMNWLKIIQFRPHAVSVTKAPKPTESQAA